MKSFYRLAGFLFAFFAGSVSVFAYSFPFREFTEGDPVPDVTLYDREGPGEITFSQFKGRSFIAVFWGADLPAKMQRASKALEKIESLSAFLEKRDILLLSVNAQGDDSGIIQEVISRSKSTVPVYLDQEKKAYGALGIFVMPAILLVDGNGKAIAGIGFSHDMTERLQGAVEIMLGEKTPEQVQAELLPEMKIKSHEEMTANRHLNYGRVMLEQGSEETAFREFLTALKFNKELFQARIELGCLYIKKGNLEKAAEELAIGLLADPDSFHGLVCQGELKMKKGLLDDALNEFEILKKDNPMRHEILYLLGQVYEAQMKPNQAMVEYKQAFHGLRKQKMISLQK